MQHLQQNCPRKQLSINILETLENNYEEINEEEYFTDEGEQSTLANFSTVSSLQKLNQKQLSPENHDILHVPIINDHVNIKKDNKANEISEVHISSTLKSDTGPNNNIRSEINTGTVAESITHENDSFSAALWKLSHSTFSWNKVQKSKSPRLPFILNNVTDLALLDSGAELNVLDADFANKVGINIAKTSVNARAANKQLLNVQGQSATDGILYCKTNEGSKMVNLGLVLIVQGLGVACIVGQPGIENNNIIYLPQKQTIILAGGNSVHQVPWNSSTSKHCIARPETNAVLLPGDSITYKLPSTLEHLETVAVTPRAISLDWLKPAVHKVEQNAINLVNTSSNPVLIKKSEHLADIRSTEVYINKFTVDNISPQFKPDNF